MRCPLARYQPRAAPGTRTVAVPVRRSSTLRSPLQLLGLREHAVNNAARAPGRTNGAMPPPFDESINTVGAPLPALTLVATPGERNAMMRWSSPHDGTPRESDDPFAMSVTGPPLAETFLISRFSVRKPIQSPSGEKNAAVTPSVPGSVV